MLGGCVTSKLGAVDCSILCQPVVRTPIYLSTEAAGNLGGVLVRDDRGMGRAFRITAPVLCKPANLLVDSQRVEYSKGCCSEHLDTIVALSACDGGMPITPIYEHFNSVHMRSKKKVPGPISPISSHFSSISSCG